MNAVFKQTPRRQFSILIDDSDLREIDFHETSKRAAPKEQTIVVRLTPCHVSNYFMNYENCDVMMHISTRGTKIVSFRFSSQ